MPERFRVFLGVVVIASAAFAVSVVGASGGAREYLPAHIPTDTCELRALVALAPGATRWVIFTHGNRGEGQAHPLYVAIRDMFPSTFNVIAIDLLAFGQSKCGLVPAYSPNRTTDLIRTLDYLRDEYGVHEKDVTLVGHSLGAVLSMSAGSARPDVAVLALGPGDFTRILATEEDVRAYANKLKRMTGQQVSEADVRQFQRDMAPERILDHRAKATTIVVITGNDLDGLLSESPAAKRLNSLTSITVPFADHMYGTEQSSLVGRVVSQVYLVMLRRALGAGLAQAGETGE